MPGEEIVLGRLFSTDGKFFAVTSKIFDLILVTLLWMVGCLPVVTILTSTAGMYHTAVKCVRYDQGGVLSTFWDAYRKNLNQGIVLTILFGGTGALLGWGNYHLFWVTGGGTPEALAAAILLLLLSCLYLSAVFWIVPVFSRFANSLSNLLRLDFVIALRYFLRFLPGLALLAAAGAGVFVSVPLVIVLPGEIFGCYSTDEELGILQNTVEVFSDRGGWTQINNFPRLATNAVNSRYDAEIVAEKLAAAIRSHISLPVIIDGRVLHKDRPFLRL